MSAILEVVRASAVSTAKQKSKAILDWIHSDVWKLPYQFWAEANYNTANYLQNLLPTAADCRLPNAIRTVAWRGTDFGSFVSFPNTGVRSCSQREEIEAESRSGEDDLRWILG